MLKILEILNEVRKAANYWSQITLEPAAPPAVAWKPSDSADTELWLDPTQNVTDTSNSVDSWDSVVGSYSFTEKLNQPSTNLETINSLNVISFLGNTAECLQSANVSVPENGLYTSVVRVDSIADTDGGVFSCYPDSAGGDGKRRGFQVIAESSSPYNYDFRQATLGPDAAFTTSSFDITNLHILTIDFDLDTGQSTMYINGTAYGNSTAGGTVGLTTPSRVSIFGDLTGSNVLEGVCGDVVISNSRTEAERQLHEGYLAHRWGLTSELPSDHPYKTTAPTIEE